MDHLSGDMLPLRPDEQLFVRSIDLMIVLVNTGQNRPCELPILQMVSCEMWIGGKTEGLYDCYRIRPAIRLLRKQ